MSTDTIGSNPDTDADGDVRTDTDSNTEDALSSPLAVTSWRSPWVWVVGLAGLAIVGGGLWLAAGVGGLIATAAIGLCWYLLSGLYAVAVGHATLLLFTANTVTPRLTLPPEVLIAEGGLVVLLIVPALDTNVPGQFIGAFIVTLTTLLGLAVAAYWWSTRLWVAAGVLIGAFAVVSYGLYRYELVRLGLIEDKTETI